MSIRNTAKAILFHNGKILVNKCVNDSGKIYYDLPGGGQNQFETIKEALAREVLEETGYTISVGRFVALAEEICDNDALRKAYFDYTHRIFHIFLAYLENEKKTEVSELDWQQVDSLWVPIESVDTLNFRPANLTGRITSLIDGHHAQYLECAHFVNL
ncbi:hypothetical protein SDC9_171412 [bioreactor metagenome]|uniref:Nudix hydrolase domain-containing protein n=1 Tax=bioreactor metagenome TaxID=1076179 RepID=A0A645GE21_9ZZZZ